MQARSSRRVIGISILIVVIGLFAALGYRYWYQPTYDFVEVDDAQVTGYLTHIAAPAAGQVKELSVHTGDTVKANDTLASIQVIAAAPSLAVAAPAVPRLLTFVTSPVAGRVAARSASVGDTVAPGQTLVTVTDLGNLWVEADVDEARIAQVALNQAVDVSVSALGGTLHGRVVDIGSATTEVANPASVGGFTSSDSTKKIPVRIAVDWQGAQALPGMTTVVTIYIK
jgi:multidrug resistance efflux pump